MIKRVKNINKFCVVLLVISAILLLPKLIKAATLYLTPDSGSYHKKDTFLVDIRLDTEGEYINAVEVGLGFSNDILEFVDFSKGNSVLNLFIKEPYVSDGSLYFLGGAPAGYQGPDGLLGRIAFRARETDPSTSFGASAESTQNAKIKFLENSQVLLNDGLGAKAKLKTREAVFTVLKSSGAEGAVKDEWERALGGDIIPPEPFEAKISQDPDLFDGKYFITFSAVDKQTGIDYYEAVEADSRGWLRGLTRKIIKEKWKIIESPYLLKDQKLRSEIKIKAVDKAGNYRIVILPPLYKSKNNIWLLLAIFGGLAGLWLWRRKRRALLRKK